MKEKQVFDGVIKETDMEKNSVENEKDESGIEKKNE